MRELILGLREAMVLPSDEELYARFQASMSGNKWQMLLNDLQTERNGAPLTRDWKRWCIAGEVVRLERQTRPQE